ncbi:MAG: HNH endonuclease [Armatimonadetes bacterium]|nr:HNH endonuclease [Armatimonadota bacterium]
MSREQVLSAISNITVWKKGGQRAVHKPLLLLLALARIARGETNEFPFREVEPKLEQLLREFGRPRSSHHPEYPFYRLQRDGLWTLRDAEDLPRRKSNTDIPRTVLRDHNTVGQLTPAIHAALASNRSILVEAANLILDSHWEGSYHDDILSAIGLDLTPTETVTRRPRDPAFRERVLRAYERRCAVCDFDVHLGTNAIALDAAHIMWHQAGGPDRESNGLALCALHHRLFDRGAFTLSLERQVVVSQDVSGSRSVEESLLRYHGRSIRTPQAEEYLADRKFIGWHDREVFRGPGRASKAPERLV